MVRESPNDFMELLALAESDGLGSVIFRPSVWLARLAGESPNDFTELLALAESDELGFVNSSLEYPSDPIPGKARRLVVKKKTCQRDLPMH